MEFWEVFWLIVYSFFFVAYLIVVFHIVTDLFRDRELSGWWKALWLVCLLFFPLITALVYLVSRGRGMAHRQSEAVAEVRRDTEGYIRQVSGAPSPADQIASAKALLDAGTISAAEFESLKAKALV